MIVCLPAFFASTASLLPMLANVSAAGGVGISWGWMMGALLVWFISTVATWLVASKVTSAVLHEQNKQMAQAIETLFDKISSVFTRLDDLKDQIATGKEARKDCELRAVKSFATQDQFAQTLVEISANHREAMSKLETIGDKVRESVARVHRRVDETGDRLTRVEERTGKRP